MKKSYIDPKQLPPVERATLRRIAACLRPHAGVALLVVVAIIASALLNLALPYFVKRIVDVALPAHDRRELLFCCVGLVVGPLVAGLLQVGQKYGAELVGQRVMLDLRVAIYRQLHRQSLRYFTHARAGEAVSHVLNDVQGVGNVMSNTLADLVQDGVILLSTTAYVLVLDWRLALLAVGLLPLFIAPTRRVGKRRRELKRRAQQRVAELTGILTETLSVSGVLLQKTFGTEEHETARLKTKAGELAELALEQTLTGRWFQMLLGAFEAIGPALVFGAGGWLVLDGRVPLGTVVAFVTLLKRLYAPASHLAGVQVELLTSYAYFNRVFEVLDRVPEIVDAPGAPELPRGPGRVEFRGVAFAHRGGVAGLQGIDLELPPGTTTALVGPSGAGKSTLALLVPRLHDVDGGALLVDGHDVRSVTQASLRAQIALVAQETFLFHATVRENLAYGRPEASAAEIEAAARQAQIHDVIAALPAGYDTLVGERGHRFSGGERQRLAIARALLKDPRILILDEATNALDPASEQLVQRGLDSLRQGRTSLVIAHRLSTIRDADQIVVLAGGRIVERGRHEELLAANGLYARLCHAGPRTAAAD